MWGPIMHTHARTRTHIHAHACSCMHTGPCEVWSWSSCTRAQLMQRMQPQPMAALPASGSGRRRRSGGGGDQAKLRQGGGGGVDNAATYQRVELVIGDGGPYVLEALRACLELVWRKVCKLEVLNSCLGRAAVEGLGTLPLRLLGIDVVLQRGEEVGGR